jgi:PBP1b-binding outer membrane lipoprotein LpoB
MKKLTTLLLILAFIVSLSACTKRTCPTYAYNKETKTDSIKIDTVRNKFSTAEKIGAGVFIAFAIYCIQNQDK